MVHESVVYWCTKTLLCQIAYYKKIKAFHTRYRALGPELILVYRQSARR